MGREINVSDPRKSRVFKRIEKDIREKDKRVRINEEKTETYVDRDRAVAVKIGEQDLKGSILRARGNIICGDISREPDEQLARIVVEQASHEFKNGDPAVALSYLKNGITKETETYESQILKSKCMLLCNELDDALNILNHLMKTSRDSRNPEILTVKGDTLYHLGSFEHALVNYHRAFDVVSNKDKDQIVEKIRRSELAVECSIGKKLQKYAVEYLKSNVFQEQLSATKLKKFNQKTKEIPVKLDNSLLTSLAEDHEFLENFEKKMIKQGHVPRNSCLRAVVKKAREGTYYLGTRKDFWSQHS